METLDPDQLDAKPGVAAKDRAPGAADIRAAARRIAGCAQCTPALRTEAMDRLFRAQLFFKCENWQRTGSFKFRGATNAVRSLPESLATKVLVTHSSGNHGAALSLAASLHGYRAWVVMPQNAVEAKKKAVELYGGRVFPCEPTAEARQREAQRLLAESGAAFVHPYDNADVIAGQGTAALELLSQAPEIDLLLAPVGGGGLLSGTAIAAGDHRHRVSVIGAEPAGADDAFRSVASGRLVSLAHPATVADGLRAPLCQRTFDIIRERVERIVTVSERAIVEGMRVAWEGLRVTIEPSAAVVLGAMLEHPAVFEHRTVGVILSGGNTSLHFAHPDLAVAS